MAAVSSVTADPKPISHLPGCEGREAQMWVQYPLKTMYYSSRYDKIKSNVSVPIQVPSSGKERDRERQ